MLRMCMCEFPSWTKCVHRSDQPAAPRDYAFCRFLTEQIGVAAIPVWSSSSFSFLFCLVCFFCLLFLLNLFSKVGVMISVFVVCMHVRPWPVAAECLHVWRQQSANGELCTICVLQKRWHIACGGGKIAKTQGLFAQVRNSVANSVASGG